MKDIFSFSKTCIVAGIHQDGVSVFIMSSHTLSIIVPAMNEDENINPLIDEILAATTDLPLLEIVYVDDGSTDRTLDVLRTRQQTTPTLRILRHEKNAGQSAAMMTGARAARGTLLIFMDGDGQNDPSDIPILYNAFLINQSNKKLGLVAGQRRKRQDTWFRRLSSRIANKIRSSLLKDGVRDTGCSLKLFRRDIYINLPYFNHMHRFLPALVRRDGFDIDVVDVNHRPRLRGVSKYGLMNRLWVGIVDLFGVMWLQSRIRHPRQITEITSAS
jgi:dolichol-phosphate mannosyltransferase